MITSVLQHHRNTRTDFFSTNCYLPNVSLRDTHSRRRSQTDKLSENTRLCANSAVHFSATLVSVTDGAVLVTTPAQNDGTWLSVLLPVDCLFSCALWFNDQLSSLWVLRHGSADVPMPVDLITKFQLPAFRSLLWANRKLPFRNLNTLSHIQQNVPPCQMTPN